MPYHILSSQDFHHYPYFIHLKVQDTGVGIAAQKLPHIFNRFYQVDNSTTRTSEGIGIGLALVKELVEVQNGTITVQSEVNKGTSTLGYLNEIDNSIKTLLELNLSAYF